MSDNFVLSIEVGISTRLSCSLGTVSKTHPLKTPICPTSLTMRKRKKSSASGDSFVSVFLPSVILEEANGLKFKFSEID